MDEMFLMDNVIELPKPKEAALRRDEEAYKEFRAFLDADEKLYNHWHTYYIGMRHADDDTKDFYNEIKNELMSHIDKMDPSIHVRYELKEDSEVFYLGNIIARFRIAGGTLLFYLNLDPTKYQTKDAIHKDVSDDPRFAETPLLLKINKLTRAQKAITLIRDLMSKNGCEKEPDYIEVDYASFFCRDVLYVSRKVREKERDTIVEQTVIVTDHKEIRADDVISLHAGLGAISHMSEGLDIKDEADEVESVMPITTEDARSENLEDGNNNSESDNDSSCEREESEITAIASNIQLDDFDTSDETDESEEIIGEIDSQKRMELEPAEGEANAGDGSETDIIPVGEYLPEEYTEPELFVITTAEEVLEEEAEEDDELQNTEEPIYIYRNVSSAQERPTFRDISGIKRTPLEPQTNYEEEKKSIFTNESTKTKNTQKKKKANIWRELSDYGYNFIFLRQLEIYALAIALAVGLGLLYKLKWPFILVLVASVLICLPSVLSAYYRNKYEEKRYRDAESYIEQMLYSFRRNSKILMSLNDALVVFPNGYMHDRIVEAIDCIRNFRGSGNVYEKALRIIEDAYPCRRIKSLHRYMIKVEGIGGKHEAGVNALLRDRRQWIDRTAAFRKQCSALIKEILVSGIFSLIMACVIIYMMPSNLYDLSSSIVYQIATTIFVIVNLLVVRTTLRSTVVYLQDENNEQAKKMVKRINWLRNYNPKAEFKKSLKQSLIFVVVAIIGIIMKNALIVLVGAVLAAFTILIKRQFDYRSVKKRARREIEKVYPDWLLELALLLQTDNLHVAIEKTLDTAPLVLQYDLRKLADDITRHPVDLAPYVAFFDFIPMENVQSSMKLLYSISTFGAVDESVQISELVERNHTLMEQAERIRNDDKLSRVFTIKFVPMLSSSIKMLVDLMLFLFSYLSLIGTLF